MNRVEDNKNGLKLLFDGMPVEKLPAGFNSRLMESVQAAVQKRARRREKLGEILLLSIIAVAALTGLFLVLRHFNPSLTEDAVASVTNITIPDMPSITPLIEYLNSPLLGLSVFVAIGILLLLVLDHFVRKGYANRHSMEL